MELIVDTDVLVRAERRNVPVSSMTQHIDEQTRESELARSVITLSELAPAQKRTHGSELIVYRQAFPDAVRDAFPVHVVDAEIAITAGLPDGELKPQGHHAGFADLLIAATALRHHYRIYTHTLRDFERVPALHVVAARQSGC